MSGSDAATFLQGQFTNELQQRSGSATYGLWLNQKGKVLADSHVLKIDENEFVVISIGSTATVIRQRLEEYIVADDVVLSDATPGMQGLLVWGQQCAEILEARPAGGQFLRAGESFIFAGRQVQEENFQFIGPEKDLHRMQAAFRAAGALDTDRATAEFARISAGLPAIPQDIGPGDLPNEGGLEAGAISYTKGCYLGQEVMARLKNLGRIRRRLHVVQGSGPPPPPAAALYQAGAKLGELRSVAAQGNVFAAFAMLSLGNLNPGAPLALGPDHEPTLMVVPHG